jgi:hypothetical protein
MKIIQQQMTNKQVFVPYQGSVPLDFIILSCWGLRQLKAPSQCT